MDTTRQSLIDLGFEPVRSWQLEEDVLLHNLTRHTDATEILYAFVIGDQVMYIGKSVKTLAQRMYGYQRPGSTQRTNVANHNKLRERLTNGDQIEILVFVDNEHKTHRGFPISLAAGMEDGLIKKFNPPWNHLGRDRGLAEEVSISDEG